jgi:carbamoyltransferase
MLTLGIHEGHTATACILEDGQVLACISEERLNRSKEWEGFPSASIQKCLEITGKSPAEFDAIGFCSLMPQIGYSTYHKPLWTKRLFGHLTRVLPKRFLQRQSNIKFVQAFGKWTSKNRREELVSKVREMGFSCDYDFYEHHLLHASTTFYTNWYKPEKTLVITLDGSGDGVCGSINIGQSGKLTRLIGLFNYNSICEFYTKVTEQLGMKPMSHEFKVMGMSPYADEKYRQELLDVFRTYYKIPADRPLEIVNESGRWKWQYFDLFKETLFQKRFDNVAGAVQDVYEEVVLQWVKNAIDETGIGDLALSGGGFMNVKLNQKILDLPEVKTLFILPSCGDESNALGASIQAAIAKGYSYQDISPLKMVYWGPEYSDEDVKTAIDRDLPSEGFHVTRHDDIHEFVGKQLATGKIIGRMTGRMEWGARSLGNRSIVADPRSQHIIHRINKAIKMRDFWMPFAPAVLEEKADRYFHRDKEFKCPFMAMAFETKPEAENEIIAGLHPFDDTARAQLVDTEFSPDFYRLIKSFEAETGVSGVLNTSFNLHGDAVVCTPEDAIYTFLNSDLDAVQIENYFIERVRH